jgi:ATP-dependent Lon protease
MSWIQYRAKVANSLDAAGNRVEAEIGIAFLTSVFSAIKRTPVQAAMLVMGDLSIQGNIKGVRSLTEPLQIGMDNGARRVLVPTENKRSFLEVNADIIEKIAPIFYGDVKTAAFKSLGIT